MVMLGSKLGELRAHVNSHLSGRKFEISDSWLSESNSRWCHCGHWITSLSLSCSTCRGSHSEIVHRTPLADGLPPPPGMKPDISIRLRGSDVQPLPEEVQDFKAFPDGDECKASNELSKVLLDLCQVDVPLIKFLPRPAASPFATAWAGLLRAARSLASWEAVFMFPKAVLLAPYRMGKKTMKKKGSMATQVLERIRRWSCDREALWAEVLARASGRKKGQFRAFL